eukprot:10978431-Ditylum_brightwellii.AAC.1
MTSELIGRHLLSHATAADEVPREYFGGLKYKSAIDMAVCRVLNWNILQQRCWAGGVASVDA